jgi:hypothetical protein
MLTLAMAFLLLAVFVTMGNIVGWLGATKEHGYSCVPLISLMSCLAAYSLASDVLGPWVFLATVADPGTWGLAILPVYLLYRALFVPKGHD